jgi:hypothetical protein
MGGVNKKSHRTFLATDAPRIKQIGTMLAVALGELGSGAPKEDKECQRSDRSFAKLAAIRVRKALDYRVGKRPNPALSRIVQ